MEKTDAELKAAISRNESYAELGGLFVILGVVSEFVRALLDPTIDSLLTRVVTLGPTATIALGVAAEVLFSRKARAAAAELQRRSEEKIAELQRDAAEAQMMTADAALGADNPKLWALIQEKMSAHLR